MDVLSEEETNPELEEETEKRYQQEQIKKEENVTGAKETKTKEDETSDDKNYTETLAGIEIEQGEVENEF